MRNYLKVLILFVCISVFGGGCGMEEQTLQSGMFEANRQSEHADLFKASLKIDAAENSFLFSSDLLSSYLYVGTYEIKVDILTATTHDGKYKYLFKILDEDTLSFMQEGSSPVITIDEQFSEPVQDGTEFVRMKEETE